jgi:prepilin-type N-terminal cleavage/methylation domain-containing protein/prepilin-type processing-associated H-X9-DG protein
MRRHGFTLIELLVVVAIIAVLMGILLPSLGAARKKSKSARCLSNVRGLSATMQTYIAEYSNLLPYVYKPDNFWVPIFRNYAQVDKMRLCPSADYATGDPPGQLLGSATTGWFSGVGGVVGQDAAGHDFVSGYGINGYIEPPVPGDMDWANGTTATASATATWYWRYPIDRQESAIPAFADCIWVDGWPHARDDPPPTSMNPTAEPHLRRFCIDRHDMAINVSFLDGHAETVALRRLWSLTWNRQWNSANEVVPNPLPIVPRN